jgi:hypothetical protein
MALARRSKVGLALAMACAAAAGLLATGAGADQVRVGTLVLTAHGGFEPRLLPKRSYAPISFQGRAEVTTTDGTVPPALRRLRLDFDRDGRLQTAGLPTCAAAAIEAATPQQARRACAGALVGRGSVEAVVALPGQGRVEVASPLSFFNGTRQNGHATVIAHAQTTFPALQTYVVVIPVERRGGGFSYRATFDIPEIAGGYGSLTHVDAKVGRRYRSGGRERSYISARCSDGILQTNGFASFADGTIISGTLFRGCQARP